MSYFGIPIFLLFTNCAKQTTAREVHPMYADAEYKRLAREVQRLERKERWEMLDSVFNNIRELNVEIKSEHWRVAANANQEIGNIGKTREYLSQAIKVKSDSKTKLWLKDVEENYGEVYLHAKSTGDFVFKANESPMDPIAVRCIEYASESLKNERLFSGMLPKGKYTFVDEEFEVLPGIEVRRELDPKLRKKGLKEALITKPTDVFEEE